MPPRTPVAAVLSARASRSGRARRPRRAPPAPGRWPAAARPARCSANGRYTAISAASANGTRRNSRYVARARASPIRTARVRFPAVASDPMSRRLLTISSAHDSRPGGHRGREPEPRKPPHLHERGPGHRRHAEEHEDGHLAEPPVPVGARPAGVEPGGEHAQRPGGHDPPRGHRREHQTEAAGQEKARESGVLHRAGRRRPRPDQPHGPGPPPRRVGAPHPVAVVVGVVHPHLQRERHQQREQRPPPGERVVPRRDTRPDEHRHHRRRQRPGPRPGHPIPRTSHRQILRSRVQPSEAGGCAGAAPAP